MAYADDDDDDVQLDPEQAKLKTLPRIAVKQNDLPDVLFRKVKLFLADSLDHTHEKDIAASLKKLMDAEPALNAIPGKGPWQCIIGRGFAGALTHEASHVCFFDVVRPTIRLSVLLFKSLGVQSE